MFEVSIVVLPPHLAYLQVLLIIELRSQIVCSCEVRLETRGREHEISRIQTWAIHDTLRLRTLGG